MVLVEGGPVFCLSVAQLILGRFPGWAWRGRLECLPFGAVLDNLWALLGMGGQVCTL